MRKIVFLNGCINSGTSTIANRLKMMVPNLAHVEVDDLHGFISWMPIERAIHLNWENAANITKTFVRHGIDVVFTYPLSKANYDYVLTKFVGVEARFIPITLYTTLEKAKRQLEYVSRSCRTGVAPDKRLERLNGFKLTFVLLICLSQFVSGEDVVHKNLVRIGLDQHLRYERKFHHGFKIGTSFAYRIFAEGGKNIHMDQQPEIAGLALAHEFDFRGISIDNAISWFHSFETIHTVRYNGTLFKRFSLREDLDFSPSINLIQYTLRPQNFENNDSWSGYPHEIDIRIDAGMNMEWKF